MSDLVTINAKLEEIGKSIHDERKAHDELLSRMAKSESGAAEMKEQVAKWEKQTNELLAQKDELVKMRNAIQRLGNGATVESGEHGEQKSADKKAFDSAIRIMLKGQGLQAASIHNLPEAERKALSNAIGQDGGYRVQPYQDPMVDSILYDTSPMRSVASVVTIGTNVYENIGKTSRAGSSWVGELGNRTSSTTAHIAKISIPVHEHYSYQYLTQQHIEDASYDVIGETSRDAALEFAIAEATAFVTGDGVDRPRGFTTYTAKTANADVYTIDQIGTKVAASTGAVTTDELIDLKALVKVGYRQGLTFAMNRATEAAIRKLRYTSGTNEYIWQYSLQAGEPDMLLGVPVAIMEDMPDMATGAVAIAIGDFRRGYKIVDRVGMDMLDDPYTGGQYRILKYRSRVGGGITVAGFDCIKYLKMA